MMRVLRLSLKYEHEEERLIICICRGKSERDIQRSIASGAETIRDLQRCGIGDQCGSCHHSLRMMLAQAAAASSTPQPCPACTAEPAVAAVMA